MPQRDLMSVNGATATAAAPAVGVVRPADASEHRRVLETLLASSHIHGMLLDDHVRAFEAYARALSLDLSLQWVLHQNERWLAVALLIASPGRSAMVLLPEQPLAGHADLAALLGATLAHAAKCRMRLVQVIVRPELTIGPALISAGFRHMAKLRYLERRVSAEPLETIEEDQRIKWLSYEPRLHGTFAEVIASSYVDSQDCPGLNGLRDLEDVMAGHKAAARHEPQWWQLALVDNEPSGCILLGEVPGRGALEVVYMGVHPAARRRGLGRALLNAAVATTRAAGLGVLTLAVDAANAPAIRLYEQFRFRETTQREAWIALPT